MEAKKKEKNGTDERYPLFEPDHLKDFIRFIEDRDIAQIEIRMGGDSLFISKTGSSVSAPVQPVPASAPDVHTSAPAQPVPVAEKFAEIVAPLVGTFYTAPSPKDPPFVKVGDLVKKGQTVCVIEAMKVFNNIPAEAGGVIREICVKNEQPVEFGQVLFLMEAR